MTITPETMQFPINPATGEQLSVPWAGVTISKTHFSWRQLAFATGARQHRLSC